MANEIDSPASYIKDSSAITQSVLAARVAGNGLDVNAYAEPAAITADNFLDSCQANGERVTQDESVLLNDNPVLKLITIGSLRRAFTVIMQDPGIEAMRTGRTWIRQYTTYRRYADKILAAENQDVVEAASERISVGTERENIEKELTGQDVREQGEGGATSADEACEEQDSGPESEEERQAQSSDKATTSKLSRQRESVTRAQPSTASASSEKLKKKRGTDRFGSSSNKHQKRSMTADVGNFNRKDISAFFQQTALIPKGFHQPEDIYGTFLERCSTDDPATILLLTRLFFSTASSNSFDQLSKICTTLRQNQDLPTPQATNSLRQVVQALDGLDVQFSVASVLRRYFLVSLKTHRMKLEEEHQHSPSVRTRKVLRQLATISENGQSQTVSFLDRDDTQALRKMMKEA